MNVQGVLHVASTTQSQPVAQSTPPEKKSSELDSNPTGIKVDISSGGKAMSAAQAAAQEASETAVQTAKEAMGGDLQAKRLLAKEEAAKAAMAPDKGGQVNALV